MTSFLNLRRSELLALAFAFACTCVSFSSTLELFNIQPAHAAAEFEISVEPTDV